MNELSVKSDIRINDLQSREKGNIYSDISTKGMAVAGVTLGLLTGLCLAIRSSVEISDIILLYMAGIAYVATRSSFLDAVITAALGVGLVDFLFVSPRFTFAVSSDHYLLTFTVMFVISLLISRLTIRIRRQADLIINNDKLQMEMEKEKLRTSLLSSLSHDLRTPLASISGAASGLLQEDDISLENRKELALTISEEADRLSRMIRNILDISRIESGRLFLQRDWHSFEEILATALDRTRKLLGNRVAKVNIPKDFPLIEVDGLFFEQVLINLLENSAKHTPESTEIYICASADLDFIEICFENNGPPLPSQVEERVFDKHFRASSVEGFGLGLFISREIVQAHGGEITANNKQEGGVLFLIRLPYSPPPKIEVRDE